MSSLIILATIHRLINDLLKIMNDSSTEPFEIGCRCKSPEIQESLYVILSMIASHVDLVVEKKEVDFIVCIKREDVIKV